VTATVGLDFERTISASSTDTRHVIADALRELGFELTADQLTRLEAKRGSLLGSSLMLKKQRPVKAVFDFSTGTTECAVVCHLTDNLANWMGKTWGVNRQYREIFEAVAQRVDLGLAELGRVAAQSFDEPKFWSRVADVEVLEQTNSVASRAAAGAAEKAGRVLHRARSTSPSVWKGVDSVTFSSGAGVAVMSLAETQAMLGVAVMVVSHPGSMPPNLARDVESFAGQVERCLTAAGGKALTVDVPDAQRPVFEFLNQQAEIRAALPLRTLHICRSCRLEKITNPEYERIAARNEKLGHLMAGVGATVGKGGISPTFVLGQVFKLKRLDPKYVCARCQGMEADERVVTFCPSCAELRREVVLRLCSKCSFDFRTIADKTPLWTEPVAEPDPEPELEPEAPLEAAAAAAEPPAVERAAPVGSIASAEVPSPSPPAAGSVPTHIYEPPGAAWPTPSSVPLGTAPVGRSGKKCQMCRRDFPRLRRVVIGTPAGFEERFICGTNLTCQMQSLVPAVEV
jgi:hypothetical protein